MLPREKRLIKGRDFDRAYQKGKRTKTQHFNINVLPNRQALTRVGVVVGKKISKKAIERNRAKRVFREAVRVIYDNIRPGLDIVIFVKKPNIQKLKPEALKTELKRVLEKAGAIK